MDLISTFSTLQYHRDTLALPYFSFADFVSALTLKSAADRLLMTVICYSLLARLNNRPSAFFNSCNAAVSYYNNSSSRTKSFAVISKFSVFVELSLSSKLEVLSQLASSCLAMCCARYHGDGRYVDDIKDEPESFISLGVDMLGNEYILSYPDYLVVLSPEETLRTFTDKVNTLENGIDLDQLISNITEENDENKTHLNEKLRENELLQHIYDQFGNICELSTVEKQFDFYSKEQKERVKFYNFQTKKEQVKSEDQMSIAFDSYRPKKFFEDLQYGVDSLIISLQEDKHAEIIQSLKNPFTVKEKLDDDLYEGVEDEEEEEAEIAVKSDERTILAEIQRQHMAYQEFKKCKYTVENFSELNKQAQYLQQNEISWLLLSQTQIVKYAPPAKKIFTHVIKMNQNENLFQSIVDFVQFFAIQQINGIINGSIPLQLNQSTTISSKNFHAHRDNLVTQLDHVFSIVHGITSTVASYALHQQNQLQFYQLKNIQQFPERSLTKNNYQIHMNELTDKFANTMFTRPRILDNGNIENLKLFPVWTRNKITFPKAAELSPIRIELGYEIKIEIKEPEPEPEPESSSSTTIEEKAPRKKRTDDDEEYYDAYDEYDEYDMITSDESMSMYGDSSSSESSEKEVIWEVKKINRREFDHATMEAVDVNGNMILQPRRGDASLNSIFDIREESDMDREMHVRLWCSPEALKQDLIRRKRAAERKANPPKQRAQKIKHKRHTAERTYGQRHHQIIVSEQDTAKFQQFQAQKDAQRLQLEKLKQMAMSKINAKPLTEGEQFAQKFPLPQKGSFQPKPKYFEKIGQQLKYQGPAQEITQAQQQAKVREQMQQQPQPAPVQKPQPQPQIPQQQPKPMNLAQFPLQNKPQLPLLSAPKPMSSMFNMFNVQPVSQQIQINIPVDKVQIQNNNSESEVKQKIERPGIYQLKVAMQFHQRNQQSVQNELLLADREINFLINEQEKKGQRGRLPITFYNEVDRILNKFGLTSEQYVKTE
ncbi:Conserved_hypothetical protein [Hexamita inflata]|uniref:Uncharacterized protein n=1 Tax=Hexamita inflata TaxID=28002 RepID=A0AA86NMY6_9EUKA|nr:Conserved hypothetical protein [Hexamita inflata]